MNPRIFGELLTANSENGDLLRQRLKLAHSDWLALHNQLLAGIDLDVNVTLQVCLNHIKLITDISSQYNLYGVQKICTELQYYIDSSIIGFDRFQLFVRKLVVWADNLLIYLDDQNDLSIIQKLFEPLPSGNSVFLKTIMGLQTDSESRSKDLVDLEQAEEMETDIVFIKNAIESYSEFGSHEKRTSNVSFISKHASLHKSEADNVIESDLLSLVIAETVVTDSRQADDLILSEDGFVPASELQNPNTSTVEESLATETEVADLVSPAYLDENISENEEYVIIGDDGVDDEINNEIAASESDLTTETDSLNQDQDSDSCFETINSPDFPDVEELLLDDSGDNEVALNESEDTGLLLDDSEDEILVNENTNNVLLLDDSAENEVVLNQNENDRLLLDDSEDEDDEVILGENEGDGLLLDDSEDNDALWVDDDVFEQTLESTDFNNTDFDQEFDFSDESIFASEQQPSTTDLFGVLHQELGQISPQIINLGQVICATEKQSTLETSIQKYNELMQRIMLATEAMGLKGLHQISKFVVNNLAHAATLSVDNREKMSAVLHAWSYFSLSYLNSPTDDNICVCLVGHFQEKGWPQALTGEQARDLYGSLTDGMDQSEESEAADPRQTVASVEDVALSLSPDINQELLEAFFIEAPGQSENFSALISQITNDDNLLENIKVAQRIAHTLKGSANLIGANGVANLTHHIEDILEFLSNNNMAPPTSLCELLQESADCLEIMIEALQGIGSAPENALSILQNVLDWANRIDQGNIRSEDINNIERGNNVESLDEPGFENSFNTSNTATSDSNTLTALLGKETQDIANNVEMLRVPVHVVDEMLRILGEVSIAISQVQEHNKRLQQRGKKLKLQDSAVQHQRFELENLVDIRGMSSGHRKNSKITNGNKYETFDSLEMDQYDALYGTAHRFIETVADSREISQQIQSGLSTLDGLFLQQQHLNKELQQIVMTTRMITVESISSRLQRTVRQASKVTEKNVRLEIVGKELLIDSNVLNSLVDPLMHMLRNAVDHGIEPEHERFDSGKDAMGLVKLTFKQIGNNVRIYCADDGRGLDYTRISEKANAKNLIAENEVLSNSELARLILQPGFSTRDSATQISGRGVGMDVVHTAILDLKGTLNIKESEHGGTVFILDLPISMVTNHSLVVKVDDETFAIPTHSLEQILAADVGKVNYFGDSSTYHLGKNVYTARSLRSLLGGGKEVSDRDIMLIAKVDSGNVAIAVDQVIDSYDLVTKNTGSYVENVAGVAGISVLGDGSVVPVLDLPELLRIHYSSSLGHPYTERSCQSKPQVVNSTNVLIVDDSLSVRKSLTQFVEDIGYHAIQARDGLEATDILKSQSIDIALVDMEMPRMNGIELTTHIRSSETNRDLPIIMITSRTQQKHQQKAEAAGVNHYLAKPYSEDTLMSSMEALLQKAV